MPKIIQAKTIKIGRFKALYFGSTPPRIESAVVFDSDTLSQKLVFQLMDISWRHGFGCSSPQFEENGDIVFSIGSFIPSSRSLKSCSTKFRKCLEEVYDFSAEFHRQLDFSRLDVSMFNGIHPEELDLSIISAVRDQQFEGSWDKFRKAMVDSGRGDEALIVGKCQEFEQANDKDIALVGDKLVDILYEVFGGSDLKA